VICFYIVNHESRHLSVLLKSLSNFMQKKLWRRKTVTNIFSFCLKLFLLVLMWSWKTSIAVFNSRTSCIERLIFSFIFRSKAQFQTVQHLVHILEEATSGVLRKQRAFISKTNHYFLRYRVIIWKFTQNLPWVKNPSTFRFRMQAAISHAEW